MAVMADILFGTSFVNGGASSNFQAFYFINDISRRVRERKGKMSKQHRLFRSSIMKTLFLLLLGCSSLFASEIKISWNANNEPDLAGYKIYRGTSSRSYDFDIDVGNSTSFVITGLQDNVEYFFTLTAYDTARNESSFSGEVSCVLGDQVKPTIVSVTPMSTTEIRITFSEVLEKGSATNIANYAIDNGITINKAILQGDRKTVRLLTSEHSVGGTYSVSVHNVTDIALPANKIADGSTFSYTLSTQNLDETPPTITLANLNSATQLDVYFSEPVDINSATQAGNYSIDNGIGINSAEMLENNIVRLTTSEHNSGKNYTVTVNNVADASEAHNVIARDSKYSYSYSPGDVVGPMITLVNVVRQDQLEVMFNEPLDQSSAETASNYQVNNGVSVSSSELDETGQIVRLQTSDHQRGQSYVLTVNNVADASVNKNPVAPNSKYTYLYDSEDNTGPTIRKVVIIDATHLQVVFSEKVDPATSENTSNYQIADIQVLNARLGASGESVTLETSPHTEGKAYVLVISGVKDASSAGNEILANSKYNYVYESAAGKTGPTIVEVFAKTATQLIVTFNKEVEPASATDLDHYAINNGATVNSAELADNNKTVTLGTSSLQAQTVYTLTVTHVTDATADRNPILSNSTYDFIFKGADTIGPLISLVKTVDAENIDVLFNERIGQEDAEKVENYSINGDIRVLQARLDGSHRVVHLHTTAHSPNKLYVLKVNNIKDESLEQNAIQPNSSYSYLYEPPDNLAPTIAMVRVVDAEKLEITFSEPVDKGSAIDVRNYNLNNDVAVLSAVQGSAKNIVELAISTLDPGKVYILIINNIYDLDGNRIAYNSSYAFTYGNLMLVEGPSVTAVRAAGETELWVSFNTKVDKNTAEQISNYTIQSGVTVKGAELDSSQKLVKLTTTLHEVGKIYVLLVKNVGRFEDPSKRIQTNAPFFYLYSGTDDSAPRVDKVNIIGETLVEVIFSKPVDRLSAENRRSYNISSGVTVLTAELDLIGTTVMLETSRHLAGVVYTLSVYGIKSKSSLGSASIVEDSYAYAYLPALQVNIEGEAETGVSFLDIGKEYYLDRNYVITDMPDDLLHARMIMTTNSERANSDTRFLTIQLSQAALVYVAYDSRATAVPNWLHSKFNKTEMNIGVTDQAERLELWQGYFPAGKLILGGNKASGARNARSMYVVLIQEPSFGNDPGGMLEGTLDGSNAFPETVVLDQNYPNPFNPTTTIHFALPIEKQVRLVIYNLLGREVVTLYDGSADAGSHQVIWNGMDATGTPVAAGIYFYRLEAWENGERNGFAFKENYLTRTGKMTFLK